MTVNLPEPKHAGFAYQTAFFIFVVIAVLLTVPGTAHAQDKAEAERLFRVAMESFGRGDYNNAITQFDAILGMYPDHAQTLKMKAVAESNLGYHERSMLNFYRVLQKDGSDVQATVGLGVGFGNFAEYAEAKKYFERALEIEPDNTVVKNYNEYAERVIAKYPYKPTEKPPQTAVAKSSQVPSWVKNNAKWWAEGQITQNDFINGIQYLVENGIIRVDASSAISNQEAEADLQWFDRYVKKIAQTVASEKRYIEYPNPSGDVIKKFLRDYVKWNFDQQIQAGNQNFPDPTYEVIDGTYVVEYKLFVNVQPSGLPLDHVGTLDHSISYWEGRDLTTSNGNPAKVKFTYTSSRQDATVWVTWVVRNLGEGVLGHANLGKGVAEVALGDYGCDGSFQLYDVDTVEKIMRHELGHSIGLGHVTDPNNIMYPSLKPEYAYCLLD